MSVEFPNRMRLFFLLLFLLTSCAAMRDDIECLVPPPPIADDEDPKEAVQEASNVPTYIPPEVLVEERLTLSDILSISLYYQLKSSRAIAAAKSAGYNYKSSLSNYYPTLTAAVDYLIDDIHFRPSTAGLSGTFRSEQDSVMLSYLLLDFGGRDASVASAWHTFQSAGFLYNQSIQDLLIDSLQAYFNYISAYETMLANQENLGTAKTSFGVVEALYEAKYANLFDREQFNTAKLQIEIALRSNEGEVSVTHGALANAMGINTSTPFDTELLNLEEFPLDAAENIEAMMHAALVYKPALSSFREEYLKRRADVLVAQSAALPTIGLQGQSSRTSFRNGPVKTINESTLQLTLNVPVFQGFYFTNQIKKAKADKEFAFVNWKLQEEAAMLDVWSNYYNFLAAKDNLDQVAALVESANRAYDSALELYKLRFAGTQDLLSAQTNLATARLLYVKNKINMAASLSNLAYSIGILTPGINKGNHHG
jgi:outer membrane protein